MLWWGKHPPLIREAQHVSRGARPILIARTPPSRASTPTPCSARPSIAPGRSPAPDMASLPPSTRRSRLAGSVFSGVTPEEERNSSRGRQRPPVRAPVRPARAGAPPPPLGLHPRPRPRHRAPRDALAHLSGTPLRHRGAEVGHFYLAEKADGEAFTDEDEEVVILFASQAASAIANARTHRDASRRACAKRLVTDHGCSLVHQHTSG